MTTAQLSGVPYYGTPPKAQQYASSLTQPPRWIVIHDTGGNPNTGDTADAEAHYAATRTDDRSNWTSAHFYVDTNGPLGSLPMTLQAWAAFSEANAHGIHIEMCGSNAGTSTAVPQTTVQKTALLVRQLCDLFGVPIRHCGPTDVANHVSGITGHYDITQGLGVGDHDDPGPSFNWSAFIALVQSGEVQEEMSYVPFFAARAPGKTAVTDIWIGNGVVRRQVISDDDWRVLMNMFWWNLGGKTDPDHQQGLTINENWTNLNALGVDVGLLTSPTPVTVDASAVVNALISNVTFLSAIAKAVNDDQANRMKA